MKLGRNLLAGLANSTWSMIVALAVIPFYIRYLGIEAYGLIGVFTALQSLLMVLDLGLAPAISREVARSSISGSTTATRNLLHTLAVFYWLTAALIASAIAIAAPLVVDHWLNEQQLSRGSLIHALSLMGLVIAARWPSGLYLGALLGAERIALTSAINAVSLTVANIGAVLVLAFYSPTIEAFFLWQMANALAFALVMRWAAWRTLGRSPAPRLDLNEFRKIWRFSAGMSGVALSAIALTQSDKIILSKVISLRDFGYYALATVVAGVLYRLVTPLFNVIYPRFSNMVAKGDESALRHLYRLATNGFASVFLPVSMGLAVCAKPLIFLWTGDERLAENVAPMITILAIGSALHGLMYFPYALQLAYGFSQMPLIINVILLAASLPLMLILGINYGAIGAAFAWLALHLFYLFLGTWMTHNRLLRGTGRVWLSQDVGIPLSITVAAGLMAFYGLPRGLDPVALIMAGTGVALLAALGSLLASPHKLRDIVDVLSR